VFERITGVAPTPIHPYDTVVSSRQSELQPGDSWHTVSVRIASSSAKQLRIRAAEEGLSMGAYVARLVESELALDRQTQPRKQKEPLDTGPA
jgi:hypothetical protein